MKHFNLFSALLAVATDIGEITEAKMYDGGFMSVSAVGEDGKKYELTIRVEAQAEKENADVDAF